MNDLTTWWQWLQTPLFNFSGTPVSGGRMLGLVLIVFGAGWGAARCEMAVRRVARNRPAASGSVYAWARILRYSIGVLATLMSAVVETRKPASGA